MPESGTIKEVFGVHAKSLGISWEQFHKMIAGKNLFGCTDATPCRYYGFDQFMRDWGPNTGHDDVSNLRIARSRSCGSGVLLTVDYGNQRQEKLWVERKDMSIGFPPVQGCPAGM